MLMKHVDHDHMGPRQVLSSLISELLSARYILDFVQVLVLVLLVQAHCTMYVKTDCNNSRYVVLSVGQRLGFLLVTAN